MRIVFVSVFIFCNKLDDEAVVGSGEICCLPGNTEGVPLAFALLALAFALLARLAILDGTYIAFVPVQEIGIQD